MTHIGQVSQTAARAAQSGDAEVIPSRRMRADAPLAMAREIDRNELGRHEKQAMPLLSDRWGSSRQEDRANTGVLTLVSMCSTKA
jgi:hypothetical protein